MPDTYKVKNLRNVTLTLRNAAGDEVHVPPGAPAAIVDASFIDFQLPQLSEAEVIGYDYAALLAPSAENAPPVEA